MVTVFTQPAGHTVFTQGSPELSERSLLPRIPEAPASGCSAPPLTGFKNPLGLSKDRGLQDLLRPGPDLYLPSQGPGCRVGEGGLGKLTASARNEGKGAEGAAELRLARG